MGVITPIDSAVGGTAQQRMGDRIKPKSLTVRGVLALASDDLNTNQTIYARIVIASQKNIKVGSAILGGGIDSAHLLRPAIAGTGNDQVPFSGTTLNLTQPLNKELFRVHYDKIVKLSGCNNTAGAVEQMPGSAVRWSYNFKSLPSAFTFDDGNGDFPNNFAPFVAIGYAFADGTAPDTVTTRLISNISTLLEFEDA